MEIGIVNRCGKRILPHNSTTARQGGTEAESFHVNQSQHSRLLDLIYQNSINALSISTPTAERGIATALSVIYNIQTKDDLFTAATIDNGVGSVLSDINTGIKTVALGTSSQNKTITMALAYTRKGTVTTENKTANFTTFIPQFAGVSVRTDFTTYAQMTADLEKFIQASAALQKQSTPASQHIWFISNKDNATILDQNNFSQSIGSFGDGVSEFYKKALVLTLADASTVTVFLYRSRTAKTLTNFTYKIQ